MVSLEYATLTKALFVGSSFVFCHDKNFFFSIKAHVVDKKVENSFGSVANVCLIITLDNKQHLRADFVVIALQSQTSTDVTGG